MDYSGFVIVLIGLFSISGGAMDWNWFMENRKAAAMSNLLGGRTRARVFYIALGVGMIILGLLKVFGAAA